MNDSYQSDDLEFCAALLYLYGSESLLSIDATQFRAVVTVDIASEDAKIMREQFDNDELAISSLKAYVKVYFELTNRVRVTRKSEFRQWNSPSWIAGKGR